MLKLLSLSVLLIFIGLSQEADGQIWPFGGGNKIEKARRDLEKRQQSSGQGNYFNPLQPEGQRASRARSDFIWPAQSAYIGAPKSGSISLTTPSRLAINQKTELQSTLGLLPWIPSLFVKRSIAAENWLWATRLGVYSSSPGLRWAREQDFRDLVDSTHTVPGLLTFSNELLVSKPFVDRSACSTGDPYLIISAGLRVDYGLSLDDNPLEPAPRHFWGSRTNGLLGKGWQAEITLRADAFLQPGLYLSGTLKYLNGRYHPGAALEQAAQLHYFFMPRLSISPGYALSYAAFADKNLKWLPFVDLSYYFGQKKGRQSGLFDQPMF